MAAQNPISPPGNLDLPALGASLSTTPGMLRIAIGCLSLLSLLLWTSALSTVRALRSVVEVVGISSFPSIEAAGDIRSGLADMDANAANGFFGSGMKAARSQYEGDRLAVATALVKAARNITFGDSEEVPIRTIADGLPVYTGMIEQARTLGYPKGLPVLHQASDLLHWQLLPAAEALDKANADPLNQEYAGAEARVGKFAFGMWFCAILLFVLLAGTQVFLTVRMRRLINIPLALASLCLLLMLLRFATVYNQSFAELKRAKADGFDSMHALWKAKATAFDANGAESFYLLEKATQPQYEDAFRLKSSFLADRPLTADLLYQAERAATSHANFDLKGFLGTEVNNITFEGEASAAVETLRAYARYMDIDAEIRRLEKAGRHQEAVRLCTGTGPDQSNGAFDRFTNALQTTADINKREFQDAIKKSLAMLDSLPFVFGAVCLVAAVLSWIGLSLRLREYSA